MSIEYRSAIMMGWDVTEIVEKHLNDENEDSDMFWAAMDNIDYIYDWISGDYCYVGKTVNDIDINDAPNVLYFDNLNLVELKDLAYKELDFFPYREEIGFIEPRLFHIVYAL